MKLLLKYRCLLLPLLGYILLQCTKNLDAIKPFNQIDENIQLSYKKGLLEATMGNYLQFYTQLDPAVNAPRNYLYYWFNLSEFRGNTITLAAPIDENGNLIIGNDAYFYLNAARATDGLSYAFWRKSYIIIANCNAVLEKIRDQPMDYELLKAMGENLFLKSWVAFNLICIYGRPYDQQPATNLGIVIPAPNSPEPIRRSTVEASYAAIVADLKRAVALLPRLSEDPSLTSKGYASREAAWALLCRVFLYMGGTQTNPQVNHNEQARLYADSVIQSPSLQLTSTEDFPNLFNTSDAGTRSEIIFAFHAGYPQLNLLINYFIEGNPAGGILPGPVKASEDYLNLLEEGDARRTFITDGNQIIKWSYTENPGLNFGVSRVPYVEFRLAEMYLNRAEAAAKNGATVSALIDLNRIHTRAGLTAYADVSPSDLLKAILKERKLELAFEGHASFDDFRNGLPMIRKYSAYKGGPFSISPLDNRVVMRLPEFELKANPQLKQNEQ